MLEEIHINILAFQAAQHGEILQIQVTSRVTIHIMYPEVQAATAETQHLQEAEMPGIYSHI